MKRIFAGIVFATAAASANAGMIGGNLLYEWLNSSSQVDIGRAYGFIAGIVDAEQAHILETEKSKPTGKYPYELVCQPNEATLEQDVAIVKQFLEKYPKIRHVAAAGIVRVALGDTWPCPRNPQR
jgi:hypothetical protein